MRRTLRIGTRGSKLALWQANWVKTALNHQHPDLKIDLTIIKTKGDKILDVPLAKIGGKGLFVKEIEEALLEDRIDLAVHSMKDMPAILPDGLVIGPIPEREDPRDVLIAANGCEFENLPAQGKVGTSSLRRGAQLKHARPDITIVPLRGNLDTRLKKLGTENLDAIVLAAAGVKRLALEKHITQFLDTDIMLPAVAQGALCIEMRADDDSVAPAVSCLNHEDTHCVVTAERALLNRLGGSCQIPIAGNGQIINDQLRLTGLVADLDGSRIIRETLTGPAEDNVTIGEALAERMLEKGAKTILDAIAESEKP